MLESLFWNLILNISLLLLVANLLTSSKLVRRILLDHRNRAGSQLLAVFFGLMCIFSTYIGVPVNGIIVNTRVISVLAASAIGGPWAGLGAAAIGSVHRYFFGGFTAAACALSTMSAGLIGAFLFPRLRDETDTKLKIIATTAATEALHMIIILLICRPFSAAAERVSAIALPMILLNSFGMLMFLSAFDNVFQEQDYESAKKLRQAFSVAERCLPHLRKGFSSEEDMKQAVDMILSQGICAGAMITDKQQILARGETAPELALAEFETIPYAAFLAIAQKQFVQTDDFRSNSAAKNYLVLASPLTMMDQPIGALVVFIKKQWSTSQANSSFVEGLATLFSAQLELSEVEYQKKLRRQAEFKALQSQVNPHFLYNSLNTISCITREDPEKARGLLTTLATYFRQTLDSDQYMLDLSREIAQVSNYLQLEKARFEDKLEVTIDLPEEADVPVPSFILQPLVENAIKYGVGPSGKRIVAIRARKEADGVSISVSDQGTGFPENILNALESENLSNHYGLRNVHNRLKSIYGERSGLHISSSPEGSKVEFFIPAAGDPEQTRRSIA